MLVVILDTRYVDLFCRNTDLQVELWWLVRGESNFGRHKSDQIDSKQNNL
jgi:hypothetical protein